MTYFSTTRARRYGWLLPLAALLLPATRAAQAQPTTAPAWGGAAVGSLTQPSGQSTARSVATDAAGSVYVTGSFTGQVTFGSTLLRSAGGTDLFVAKYVPATGTWAWAQRGGGLVNDAGASIAVSGTSVYVVGSIVNTLTNVNAVSFGGATPATSLAVQAGASGTTASDIVLAKYTDNGSTATFGWSQVAGSYDFDQGTGVAVSGPSVYLTGTITANKVNGYSVMFGGTGTTPGTAGQAGASTQSSLDIVLAKYTDNGSTATFGWSQVAGGSYQDLGGNVAVSGTSVYLTGSITNDIGNYYAVTFGGTGATAGTATQLGATTAGSVDLVLAKYTDNGSTGTFGWSQVAGGTGSDQGNGLAVSGTSVYVAGNITNNAANLRKVVFGGAGTTVGTTPQAGATAMTPTTASTDLLLAKYTDNGATATFGWSHVGGGTDFDQGTGVAVSGPNVYVTGIAINTLANDNAVVFGGTGTTPGTATQAGASSTAAFDIVLAKYTDNGGTGTLGWTQVGGGQDNDQGTGVAMSGADVYVGAFLGRAPVVTFGAAAGSPVLGTSDSRAVLLRATDAGSSGSWAALAPAFNGGFSVTNCAATDAAGNVYVTGYFTGQVAFGSTLLSSAGDIDLFVAKYVPATGTWAWAQRGGGIRAEQGSGLAVRGASVYVVGNIVNNTANSNAVTFGGANTPSGTVAQPGATATADSDIVLAKYTDQGTSATLTWTQVAGGTSGDGGASVAVSGTSVYLTGTIANTLANANAVVFGGTGTTPGTATQAGASIQNSADIVLAKYTDNGSTATFGWSQVAGGTGGDGGASVAVSGTSVYVVGNLVNTATDAYAVVFGGTGTTPGTTPQLGIGSTASGDIVLAKYTDNGPSATFGWSQVAGGTSGDRGRAVAVSGTSVYLTGGINNTTSNASAVVFGGTGTTPGTAQQNGATSAGAGDIVLAKYTDNGSTGTFGWSQVAGGTGDDIGFGLAASGTSVYVVGGADNTAANTSAVVFGGAGTTPGTVPLAGVSSTVSIDLVLAKYTDNGSTGAFQWSLAGGGAGTDQGYSVAVSGQRVYVAGHTNPIATYGPTTLSSPAGSPTAVLAYTTDASLTPLPTRAAGAGPALALYPNPNFSAGRATLSGAAPGQAVQVLDALGRLVLTATADAGGTAALALPAGLPGGVYVVRTGQQALRLAIE